MQKRHFEALARMLAQSKPIDAKPGSLDYEQWTVDVSAVADACAQFNPLFDRERFFDRIRTLSAS